MDRRRWFALILWLLRWESIHGWLSGSPEEVVKRTHDSRSSRLHTVPSSDHFSEERRQLLLSAPLLCWSTNPTTAQARGLVRFPCNYRLLNEYHFMRIGESMLEAENIWSTNPLFLTNREDALSIRGEEQVLEVCRTKLSKSVPTVVKFSLAAACVDTSNLVGREFNLGRDRLIAEYTFMDPRAIGRWDMLGRDSTQAAVWAMDAEEAGPNGLGGRPPANEDGTPHETLADQAIRLRQLLSGLETQFSGDTILLVFPDGTGPALLSCMMAGLPYNRVHELEFEAGEVRLNVTQTSILQFLREREQQEDLRAKYLITLREGKDELARLRNRQSFVSLKDQRIEEERIAIDQALAEKELQRKVAEEEQRSRLREREEQLRRDTERQERPTTVSARSVKIKVDEAKPESTATKSSALSVIGPLVAIATAGGVFGTSSSDSGEFDTAKGITNTTAITDVTDKHVEKVLVDMTTTRLNTTDNTGGKVIASPAWKILNASGNVTIQGNVTLKPSFDSSPTTLPDNDTSYSKPTSLYMDPQLLPTTKVDPEVAAQNAMDEYMERDDGASDWLRMVAEIAAEDDGEEELVNGCTESRVEEL